VSVGSETGPEWQNRTATFSCPARAQVSSRRKRPRKLRRSFPAKGVTLPWVVGPMTGVMSVGFDPFRVRPGWRHVFRVC
jgi:hypothetical protein